MNDIKDLKNQLNDTDVIIEEQGNVIKDLRQQLGIHQTEHVQRCRNAVENKKLKKQLTNGKESIAEFANRIKELEGQLDTFQTHTMPSHQWQRIHKEKDNVNEELQRKLTGVQDQLDIKEKEVKRLQHEVVDLKADAYVRAEKQIEIENLRLRLKDLEHFLKLDEVELLEYKSNINELEAEVELLRGIIDTKDNKIHRLEDGQLEVVEIVEEKDNIIHKLETKLMLVQAQADSLQVAIEHSKSN